MNYCSTNCPGRIEPHICSPQINYQSGSVRIPDHGYTPISQDRQEIVFLLREILMELRKRDRMPEGWEKLYPAEALDNEYGVTLFVPSKAVDVRYALDLLKEFAEATDEMVTACKQGYARDISKMERALKKFKEWKSSPASSVEE